MPKRPKVEPGSPTLFEMGKFEQTAESIPPQEPRPYSDSLLMLGTSSFTADGWSGSFYPKGMKQTDYLAHYARTFPTVEIDSTFYATPAPTTVESWYRKTPADFLFAVKVPKTITHEKVLKDCDAELEEYLETMGLLKEKLGPMLLQFPWFDKYAFKTSADFLERLRLFLGKLPKAFAGSFVVEVRNKGWIDETFLSAFREHKVALALTDTNWIPRPWEMKKPLDLVTSDFLYVRWLGHRKEIEEITTTWDHVVVDRTEDLKTWVTFLQSMVLDKRLRKIFAFANNHYQGFGPATVQQFWGLWNLTEL